MLFYSALLLCQGNTGFVNQMGWFFLEAKAMSLKIRKGGHQDFYSFGGLFFFACHAYATAVM